MSGSGNDFVMLDGRSTTPEHWTPFQIQTLCDRRRGIGADGLVILTPVTDESIRMAYWNADGSRTAMCGNAALCSGRLATLLELVPTGEFCLLTDAGPVRVRSQAAVDAAEINLPDFEVPPPLTNLSLGTGEHWSSLLTVGVPHLVVQVDQVDAVNVEARGRSLRYAPVLGPAGANVNFISPGETPDAPWLIRTYERGVEGETLACGTGTVAAAVALAARGERPLPMSFRSRGGLELSVAAALEPQRATQVWLSGQARLVFRGFWENI